MKRYLASFALAALLTIAATAALAWIVNPYAYWDSPVVEGINRFRPSSGKHIAVVKQRQYVRVEPVTLVAGNSRVDVGIDPGSSAWPEHLRPVYNMGLPGKGTAAVVTEIDRALFEHSPRAIFLGVEFLDFLTTEAEWRTPAKPEEIHAPTVSEVAKVDAKVLLSIDALTDSLAALFEQHKRYPANITSNGFNGLGEYKAIVGSEGHAALFGQRNRENIAAYLAGPKRVQWPGPGQNRNMAALERLAKRAKNEGIVLALFTYPYHVDLLLSFEKAGLWPAYEQWMREMAAFGDRTGVPVYVFSRIDDLTTEAVPPAGDHRTHMRWYWEGGHFKAALGDQVIRHMARYDARFEIGSDNVDQYLGGMRAALSAFRRTHPQDVGRVETAYRKALN